MDVPVALEFRLEAEMIDVERDGLGDIVGHQDGIILSRLQGGLSRIR
jgi:hypothetical protein